MDKQNTTNPAPTIHSTIQTDPEAEHALFTELELDAAHAEAVKGGEGSNANIQNFPHQLSLR
jgi:hypothetical protein